VEIKSVAKRKNNIALKWPWHGCLQLFWHLHVHSVLSYDKKSVCWTSSQRPSPSIHKVTNKKSRFPLVFWSYFCLPIPLEKITDEYSFRVTNPLHCVPNIRNWKSIRSCISIQITEICAQSNTNCATWPFQDTDQWACHRWCRMLDHTKIQQTLDLMHHLWFNIFWNLISDDALAS